jgi:hypothetical protein
MSLHLEWIEVSMSFRSAAKIKPGPLSIHAVEEFAPVLLVGAIETSEELLSAQTHLNSLRVITALLG